jgi:hypothetical protein
MAEKQEHPFLAFLNFFFARGFPNIANCFGQLAAAWSLTRCESNVCIALSVVFVEGLNAGTKPSMLAGTDSMSRIFRVLGFGRSYASSPSQSQSKSRVCCFPMLDFFDEKPGTPAN